MNPRILRPSSARRWGLSFKSLELFYERGNMKIGILKSLLLSVVLFCSAGCASTPVATTPPPVDTGFVLPQSLEKARENAMNALTVFGFEVEKKNLKETSIHGSRPNKIGLVVGSGGENVDVRFESLGPEETKVHVKTHKTFAGLLGQKNWDKEITAEMLSAVEKK